MRLKYEDYTENIDILNKLGECIGAACVSARDKKTGLWTRANLVHSVTFAKTFILIRLNEGSNLVLNLFEDGVEWVEKDINLNFGDIVSDLDLLTAFERVIIDYLYIED